MKVEVIIVAFAIVAVSGVQGRSEVELRGVDSPAGVYRCEIRPQAGGGEQVYLKRVQMKSMEHLVFTSIRSASVMWSPDEEWFAVIDALDGHMTDIHIFHIVDASGDPGAWRIEEVYSSPSHLDYDTHWAILAWDIVDGTITISCHFRDTNPTTDSGNWFTRTYDIPIQPKPRKSQSPD